ncbi:tetratricopeptide repeat protein [Bacillus shivajii]|uniref:tetratricopeptide repeat protein n=1 Tax=Bacillus shivajii TaxID=1983719 RepID=UPI001CF97D5A|nr:tetratricopeptide repeat protein [Bacillus shivajii]UCZ52732.1 tetratricopeptide repeat protein [Bacillus shivajii]
MSKVKRNDPCPCGSGKKYKKCCANSNVISFPTHLVREEVIEAQEKILHFAFTEYDNELMKFTTIELGPLTDNEDLNDAIMFHTTIWAIFNYPLVQDKETIFDVFMNKKAKQFKRPQTVETISKWHSLTPVIGRVKTINGTNAEVASVYTNETYNLDLHAHDIPAEKDLMIFFPIDIQGTTEVFTSYIHIPHQVANACLGRVEEEVQLVQQEEDPSLTAHEYLTENFPQYLMTIFDDEPAVLENEIQWDDPRHEMVGQLLAQKMSEHFLPEHIVLAEHLWHVYCRKTMPAPRKLGGYAAAVEYLVGQLPTNSPSFTQKEVAERYEVSPGTVSSRFREMENAIKDEIHQIVSGNYDGSTPPPPGSMNPERTLREVEQLLQSQEFETEEDLHEFLNNQLNKPMAPSDKQTDEEKAQDLLFDAMDTFGELREKLIEQALELDPASPDAYTMLAEEMTDPIEALSCFKKAMDLAYEKIGQEEFEENKGHFWGFVSTRPYMRAKLGYAETLYSIGQMKKAISEFEEMLALNPNDNQGIRYLLCTVYIEENQLTQAKKLLDQYKDDETAHFNYQRVLIEYLSNGQTKKLDKLMEKALRQNYKVPIYLLDLYNTPPVNNGYIGYGDETEAYDYALKSKHLWEDHVPLMDFLRHSAANINI